MTEDDPGQGRSGRHQDTQGIWLMAPTNNCSMKHLSQWCEAQTTGQGLLVDVERRLKVVNQ